MAEMSRFTEIVTSNGHDFPSRAELVETDGVPDDDDFDLEKYSINYSKDEVRHSYHLAFILSYCRRWRQPSSKGVSASAKVRDRNSIYDLSDYILSITRAGPGPNPLYGNRIKVLDENMLVINLSNN